MLLGKEKRQSYNEETSPDKDTIIKTKTKIKTFTEHLRRASLETCDLQSDEIPPD